MSRYMSLDIGDASIGIAMSDSLLITSQAFDNYRRITKDRDIDYIVDLVLEYEIVKIIVGMPYNLDDSIGTQAIKTQSFVKSLAKKLKYTNRLNRKIEIEYEDERFSSIEAKELLKKLRVKPKKISKVIDKMAAQIILQSYLNKVGIGGNE